MCKCALVHQASPVHMHWFALTSTDVNVKPTQGLSVDEHYLPVLEKFSP